MRETSKPLKPPEVHLLRLRVLWPFLVLLTAFVFFFEFIADVGGSADPVSSPPERPIPLPTPTPTPNPFPDTSTLPLARVIRVIDGGSLLVRLDGIALRVRYLGVGPPAADERCFKEAKEANRKLVEGRAVRLLADDPEVDDAGLLLRYVFLEDGQSVEASLVAEGMALARREEGSYRDYFIALEEEARVGRVGCLWSR